MLTADITIITLSHESAYQRTYQVAVSSEVLRSVQQCGSSVWNSLHLTLLAPWI